MRRSLLERFRHFAHRVAMGVGSALAFGAALMLVVVWAATGPIFHYSDSWQLTINTGTTIVTFLMVFVIQNTQNRDSQVVHLKLDELIRAVREARNELVDLEDLPDEDLRRLQRQFEDLRRFSMLGRDEELGAEVTARAERTLPEPA